MRRRNPETFEKEFTFSSQKHHCVLKLIKQNKFKLTQVVVEELRQEILARKIDDFENTLFHTSVFDSPLSFFVKLLNKAFDVNEMNFIKNGISPFFQSAIIVYLFYRPCFNANGNINTRSSYGRASLNLAFERNV